VSRNERPVPAPPREADLEKGFEDAFKEYEDWRTRQVSGGSQPEDEVRKSDVKKQPFLTRWDVLFVLIGFVLALTLGRGCGSAH
jgi:hypothetical protein